MTIITTASVRIALAHNYSTFEVSMNLENPEGVTQTDIDKARLDCQTLATQSVNEYKSVASGNVKQEIESIENRLKGLKQMLGKQLPEVTDPKEIEKIEKMPVYGEASKTLKK